jgi:hypothetical protein
MIRNCGSFGRLHFAADRPRAGSLTGGRVRPITAARRGWRDDPCFGPKRSLAGGNVSLYEVSVWRSKLGKTAVEQPTSKLTTYRDVKRHCDLESVITSVRHGTRRSYGENLRPMKRVRPRSRDLADLIDAIIAEPERARYWAEHCRWVPGTGKCTAGAACSPDCWFLSRRERERAELMGVNTRVWNLISV